MPAADVDTDDANDAQNVPPPQQQDLQLERLLNQFGEDKLIEYRDTVRSFCFLQQLCVAATNF